MATMLPAASTPILKHPLRLDMPSGYMTAIWARTDEWKAANVTSHSLITEHGVVLQHASTTFVSSEIILDDQVYCACSLQWRQVNDPPCSCGSMQTTAHIVNVCPQTPFQSWTTGSSSR